MIGPRLSQKSTMNWSFPLFPAFPEQSFGSKSMFVWAQCFFITWPLLFFVWKDFPICREWKKNWNTKKWGDTHQQQTHAKVGKTFKDARQKKTEIFKHTFCSLFRFFFDWLKEKVEKNVDILFESFDDDCLHFIFKFATKLKWIYKLRQLFPNIQI